MAAPCRCSRGTLPPLLISLSVAYLTYSALLSSRSLLPLPTASFPGATASSSRRLASGGRRAFHTAVTASDSVYNTWQCRVMYYWFKRAREAGGGGGGGGGGEMGGFTRILHSGKPDAFVDEIPTFVADPLPAGTDQGYIVLNRPWAFVQWLQKADIQEEYILMAEPDHIIVKPIPNLSRDGLSAAFPFFYIEPKKYENVLRKFFPEHEGPITKIDPIGNSPVIARKYAVLALTFAAYISFHASRKPPSIVKAVLSADWAPFSGPRGPHRLGELDVAFLSAYAVASGVVQSAGWPCVVAVVGNWFGHASNRGTIMGVWNSHTSVGNIAGSVLAAAVLEFGWGWSFLVPAFVIAALGVVVLVFLKAHPMDAGLDLQAMEVEMNGESGEEVELLGEDKKEDEDVLEVEAAVELPRAIGFLEAWKLPGVAPFAFCLFFSKLVAYTFLYWLPFYIRHNGCNQGKLKSFGYSVCDNRWHRFSRGSFGTIAYWVHFNERME
ncbi:hypothetical protein E2562_039208 [Oryza meyeriana var. granulata]|uniref:Hydroxyproline O-arabinosyltransferase-like domain-containing protein n=1 Tax=Oryza meyeriana var. granulata TaxID=110450 RepID=A0A6G1CYH5_9ORYZ|nr:hypothetical protein E2562_039208 [Oryza meyeriana var. granulata]